MNIYATGMNPADSNALKREPRVAIFQAFVEMIKYARSIGNTVTWKETKVGDIFPVDTDVVIVSSMLPRSLNCPYALGVIWTISEALKRDVPIVLYLTDWAFFRAAGEFKSIAKAGADYFFKTIGGSPQYKEDPEQLMAHSDDLLSICHQWGDPESDLWRSVQVLVPRYTNWGDVGIVQGYFPEAKPVLTFDPTPIFVEYLNRDPHPVITPAMADRYKKWLLPSLLKDDTWIMKQRLKWDVDRIGPKGFEVLSSEHAIQHAYKRSVGALCPPYPHAGSGWWRSRWIHSAWAGCVLLCDRKDAQAIGHEYDYTGPDYETRSIQSLVILAREQREKISSLLQLDMDILRDQIHAAIQGAGA